MNNYYTFLSYLYNNHMYFHFNDSNRERYIFFVGEYI